MKRARALKQTHRDDAVAAGRAAVAYQDDHVAIEWDVVAGKVTAAIRLHMDGKSDGVRPTSTRTDFIGMRSCIARIIVGLDSKCPAIAIMVGGIGPQQG